jgi:hypothetical protein
LRALSECMRYHTYHGAVPGDGNPGIPESPCGLPSAPGVCRLSTCTHWRWHSNQSSDRPLNNVGTNGPTVVRRGARLVYPVDVYLLTPQLQSRLCFIVIVFPSDSPQQDAPFCRPSGPIAQFRHIFLSQAYEENGCGLQKPSDGTD